MPGPSPRRRGRREELAAISCEDLQLLGLALGVAGSGLLWRYGLPARGSQRFSDEQLDKERARDKGWNWTGMTALMASFVVQSVAVML
jgi:hypothetical protein